MVRLSRCCTPVPGDEIMGFVTRGRGVSVHRADCANALSLVTGQAERLIDVEWDNDSTGDVHGVDRGEGPRPVAAAARRELGAGRPSREHHLLQHADRYRPHLDHALRLRARRPLPPRLACSARSSRSTASTTSTGFCRVASPAPDLRDCADQASRRTALEHAITPTCAFARLPRHAGSRPSTRVLWRVIMLS